MKLLSIIFFVVLIIGCGQKSTSQLSNVIQIDKEKFESANSNLRLIESDKEYRLEIPLTGNVDEVSAFKANFFNQHGDVLSDLNPQLELKLATKSKIIVSFRLDNSEINSSLAIRSVIFTIVSEAFFIDEKLSIDVAIIPKMESLKWPQRSLFIKDPVIQLLKNEGAIDFDWLHLGKWKVPETPSWYENPFNNISWQLFYHSLGWLTGYGELYKQTGDIKYLDKITSYLESYNNAFQEPESIDASLAYREGVVSLRMNHLLYFYLNFYREKPTEDQKTIQELIHKNIKMLQQYLDDPKYDDDNHGLIQARSGLNYVAAFPLVENKNQVLDSSLSRIDKNAAHMFSQQDGLSVEQAVDYHYVGTSMFLDAREQMLRLNAEVPERLHNTINNAIEVGAYLLFDDGTVPALGDTYYNNKWDGYLKKYYELFKNSNVTLDDFLINGQLALNDLKVLSEEGLIIAKSRNAKNKLSKVFFDAGKKRTVHGHFDNLNVVAMLDGNKLLVDSGGPYLYSYQGRVNFWSLPAHNTLVINDQVENKFDVVIDNYIETDEMLSAAATQKTTEQIDHKRAFALLNSVSSILLIVDQINDVSNFANKIEEYWHFPPKTAINIVDAQNSILTLEKGNKFLHFKSSVQPTNCNVVEGLFDSNNIPKLGWVTGAYNIATPAPVTVCNSNAKDYIKVNIFSNDLELTPQVQEFDNYVIITVNNSVFNYDMLTNKITKI